MIEHAGKGFIDNAGWLHGQDAGWGKKKGEAKFSLIQTAGGQWVRVLKARPTMALDNRQHPQLVPLAR